VTTTAVSLHEENETRLISLLANNSASQTKAIFAALAQEAAAGGTAKLELAPWHDLQTWLAAQPAKVVIRSLRRSPSSCRRRRSGCVATSAPCSA
jgi:hypothetical protein